MEQYNDLEIARHIRISGEDIDDIMASALEGGINYWCRKVEVGEDRYLGEYASDQISRGGTLVLYDSESDDTYSINKGDFLNGLKLFLRDYAAEDVFVLKGGLYWLDCGQIDANDADTIIQLAIFGELVYA